MWAVQAANVHEGSQQQISRGRARVERCTSNMSLMSVTLEVSRLSGWLNARACCQVEREDTKRARRRGSGEVRR